MEILLVVVSFLVPFGNLLAHDSALWVGRVRLVVPVQCLFVVGNSLVRGVVRISEIESISTKIIINLLKNLISWSIRLRV